MFFEVGPNSDLDWLVRREWLVANGLGGYASSTLAGINTRRYHGLLVAALAPPGQRHVLVSKLEDAVECAGWEVPLSSNFYPGTVYPDGYRRLAWADVRAGRVRFAYDTDSGRLEKSIFMVHGENTTVVTYQWRGHSTVSLAIRPLLTCRDFHHLVRAVPDVPAHLEVADGCLVFQTFPNAPRSYISLAGGTFTPTGHWYHNFQYPREAYRGLDFEEDLYCPGDILLRLEPERPVEIVLSAEPIQDLPVVERWAAEEARQQSLRRLWRIEPTGPEVESLLEAADTFLVSRQSGGKSMIAGYHWFGDWGRDTLIALPGIALVTGRHEDAHDILRSYADYISHGMLPNRFPEGDSQPDYNTADASLWYFVALFKYLQYSEQPEALELVRQLHPKLVDIITAHQRGTRYNIHVGEDGLLCIGEEGTQLTWMDAKVGDYVVTPRIGKPVEINALWYNALMILADFEARLGIGDGAHWKTHAARAEQAFRRQFIQPETGRIADVVSIAGPDFTARPNQLLAASLPYSLLSTQEAKLMLDRVSAELLTPVGLRSLAPSEQGYRGTYEGDVWSRDTAYHQGTVWAWLIGPFVSAAVRYKHPAHDPMDTLAGLLDHVSDYGVGSLAEIFDGDPPHEARGCISQAWSVGEVLRVLYEDVA